LGQGFVFLGEPIDLPGQEIRFVPKFARINERRATVRHREAVMLGRGQPALKARPANTEALSGVDLIAMMREIGFIGLLGKVTW
jgi:hypothetical protein